MKRLLITCGVLLGLLVLLGPRANSQTDTAFTAVAQQVNRKVVKVFGAGGFRGLVSYGTGVFINKEGYFLTINSHILDTRDLRIHTYDGTRYHCEVVCREPELDIALCKIKWGARPGEIEDYFDIDAALKREPLKAGTNILAFNNMFQLALRDDPVTVQRGVIAAYAPLYGRIGVFNAAYRGNVYVLDAITNNPGSAGGAITTRKGELIGLIGKELRNELTNTWLNFAIPIHASTEAPDKDGKKIKVSIADMVRLKEEYRPVPPRELAKNAAFHGIVLVPNVVERTPPYVEEVIPGSPADKATPRLRADDLIVYVEGLPVPDINTFNNIVATYPPGSEIKLEVQRGDKLTTVTLKLAAPPKTDDKK
ncbi:MAG: S1C family serine protease [Gemmataceae bacterium]